MVDNTVVLTKLEFDVLWEQERLPRKHEALTVPSPGRTHTERRQLVAGALADLAERGLVSGDRATSELADRLALLAYPQLSIDGWVWTDHRISALGVVSGTTALLAAVDGDEVWLIPARETAIAEATVAIAGDTPAGPGYSVTMPTEILTEADRESRGDLREFAAVLAHAGIPGPDAKTMTDMLAGMGVRGQFGASRQLRDQRTVRADRVVAFHDTDRGRYVYLAKPNADGRAWSTVTPADNKRIALCVQELLDEL
jgi:hypothetical protein